MKYIDIRNLPIYAKANELMIADKELADKYAMDYITWEHFHVFVSQDKGRELVISVFDIDLIFVKNKSKFYTVLNYQFGDSLTESPMAIVCFFDSLKELIAKWFNIAIAIEERRIGITSTEYLKNID